MQNQRCQSKVQVRFSPFYKGNSNYTIGLVIVFTTSPSGIIFNHKYPDRRVGIYNSNCTYPVENPMSAPCRPLGVEVR